MVYKGHIENGHIVLDDPVEMPEGTAVFVQLVASASVDSVHPDLLRFTGIIPQDVDAQSEYSEAFRAKHA